MASRPQPVIAPVPASPTEAIINVMPVAVEAAVPITILSGHKLNHCCWNQLACAAQWIDTKLPEETRINVLASGLHRRKPLE